MGKKFSLFLAAAAVLAFAIPALANAAPVTNASGGIAKASTTTANASTVVGTSTNVETTSATLGTLKCTHVEVIAWLTKNTTTEVEATHDEGTTNSATNCTAGGASVEITDPTITVLKSTKSGSGTVSLDFTLPKVGCSFSGTVPFTYTPGGSSIHIAGHLLPSKKACGTETETEIHGDFTISGREAPTSPFAVWKLD
ncbi:MAG TPA: hypothetical protein VGC32_05925 [Solirubrobacterales bacterium]